MANYDDDDVCGVNTFKKDGQLKVLKFLSKQQYWGETLWIKGSRVGAVRHKIRASNLE